MRVIFIIILFQVLKIDFNFGQDLNDCLISKWHRQIRKYDDSKKNIELIGNEFLFFNAKKVFTVYTDSTYTILGHFFDYYRVLNANKLLISREQNTWEEVPASWVNCTEYELSISGSQPYLYERIDDFSFSLIQNINQLEMVKSENIFEEFIDMIVKSPCEPQLNIFNALDGEKVGYLIKGDLVEILETQGEWVKIKYLKAEKIYWTYTSCLDSL